MGPAILRHGTVKAPAQGPDAPPQGLLTASCLPRRSNCALVQLFLQSQRHPSWQWDSTSPIASLNTNDCAGLSFKTLAPVRKTKGKTQRWESRGCWEIQRTHGYLEEAALAGFLWSSSSVRHCLPAAGNGNSPLWKLSRDSKRVWLVESPSRLQNFLSDKMHASLQNQKDFSNQGYKNLAKGFNVKNIAIFA